MSGNNGFSIWYRLAFTVMQESLTDLLMRYGYENGMEVRLVPWEEAQNDKEESRRLDRDVIAAGRARLEEVAVSNSGGMAGRRIIVGDTSAAYL